MGKVFGVRRLRWMPSFSSWIHHPLLLPLLQRRKLPLLVLQALFRPDADYYQLPPFALAASERRQPCVHADILKLY